MIQAIRGRDNYCFALIDTNIGKKCEEKFFFNNFYFLGDREDLPNEEKQDLISMYRCIYMAVDELEQELIHDIKKEYLTYEKQSNDMRLNYLFDRIWYMDICNRIKQFSNDKIQEFINNKSKWNDQIKEILSVISRIIKRKEINPSDVKKNRRFSIKNEIYLFLVYKYSYPSDDRI